MVQAADTLYGGHAVRGGQGGLASPQFHVRAVEDRQGVGEGGRGPAQGQRCNAEEGEGRDGAAES